jgi:phosphoserine phosphatase
MTPAPSNNTLNGFLDAIHPDAGDVPLAVFDCDGTVILGDIGEAMLLRQLEQMQFRVSPASVWDDHPDRESLEDLYRRLVAAGPPYRTHAAYEPFCGMVLDWYYGQMAVGRTPKACADIVRLLAGFRREEAARLGRETLEAELGAPFMTNRLGGRLVSRGVRYIRETADALRRLAREGWDIVVISGSNRWSVDAVFAPLGIPPENVIGIDLLDSGGVLGGTAVKPIPVADGKVKALRAFRQRKPDVVFSDSKLDMPLFREARHRVLVSHNGVAPEEQVRRVGGNPRDRWHVIAPATLVPDGIPT